MYDTIDSIFANRKGILAADERDTSLEKRFKALGVANTPETRQQYRETLFSTQGIEQYIGGIVLAEDTAQQSMSNGVSFVDYILDRGIMPGVKVDAGTEPFALNNEERITMGLTGLREKLRQYASLGLRFAKWRATFVIGNETPTTANITAEAFKLAEYAAYCQEVNIVPIVEPDILIDGAHDIKTSYVTTTHVLRQVMQALYDRGVDYSTMILKSNMVTSGKEIIKEDTMNDVATMTTHCLMDNVPSSVGAIVFLSGGQEPERAMQNLNTINNQNKNLPWPLSFCFGRALHAEAMKLWAAGDTKSAQQSLLTHAEKCHKAALGEY